MESDSSDTDNADNFIYCVWGISVLHRAKRVCFLRS